MLTREINDFKINKSSIQMMIRIVRGREKCISYLKAIYAEALNDENSSPDQNS